VFKGFRVDCVFKKQMKMLACCPLNCLFVFKVKLCYIIKSLFTLRTITIIVSILVLTPAGDDIVYYECAVLLSDTLYT